MRKAILSASLVLLTTGLTFAADLPRRVPPMATAYATPANWNGFYLGGNVGGGVTIAASDFSAAGTPFASIDNSLMGFVGGGQAGYNWRNGTALLGVEADFQFSGMSGTLTAPCPVGLCGVPISASFTEKIPWFGTVRGRLGYASDSWLIYATGGYAYAHVDTDAAAAAPGISASLSQSDMRSGWTVGGGIEAALSRNWSARVEYLYLDFGLANNSWTLAGLPTVSDNARITSNIVRAGLNYRF